MNIDALRPYQVKAPEIMPYFNGEVIVGELGSATFILTMCVDGQIEASISKDGRPASDGQCMALFRKLACEPLFEDHTARRCRMFTVVDVRGQYRY